MLVEQNLKEKKKIYVKFPINIIFSTKFFFFFCVGSSDRTAYSGTGRTQTAPGICTRNASWTYARANATDERRAQQKQTGMQVKETEITECANKAIKIIW